MREKAFVVSAVLAITLACPFEVNGQTVYSVGSHRSPLPTNFVMLGTNMLTWASPTRGDIHRFVTLPGSIRAHQQATIYAKVSGYLKTIAVDKGDSVKAGAMLAELEAPEMQSELARAHAGMSKALAEVIRAEAEIARSRAETTHATAQIATFRAALLVAQAELSKARAESLKVKAESEVARADLQRLREARKRAPDLVVPSHLDEAQRRMETSQAQERVAEAGIDAAQAAVEASRARITAAEALALAARAQQGASEALHKSAAATAEAMKAEVSRAETMMAYLRVTAPFSGTVTSRFLDTGAFVPAASSSSTPQNAALVTLMDFSTVRLQVFVPEVEASLVTVGQPVRLVLDGLPGKSFEGRVTRMAGALEEASKTMLVEAELPNPGGQLRPGMYATVRLGVELHTGVALIPVEALVQEKAAAFVFVLDQGKARKTPVKPGFNDGTRVEIASGLPADAKVLLVGKMPITDGQAVNVTEAK